MIDKTISHYRILEKLGEGGMGVVYKAEDTKLKRTVALKFLPPQTLASEADKTRFLHEAQAAAALDHPNIGTIHEIDEADGPEGAGRPFIVMAYIDGQTLKKRIEAGPLSVDEALDIATHVAQGLQAAHEKGIVHRDIKSANIMITSKGQAKIMDFGLARLTGRTQVTKSGATVGTVAYMSPEQAVGEGVDHRTDIWSFGVVMYEMLTGKMPFKSEYEQALVYCILHEKPEAIAAVRRDVPPELEGIVMKCLEKEAPKRYQDTNELLADLYRLKGTAPPVEMTWKFIRKKVRPFVLPAIALVILSLAGFGYFFFRGSLSRNGRAEASENSLAVMYFENQSGEKDLDKVLANMLTTNLARSRDLNVVSSQHLFDILKGLGKQDVQTLDMSVATEVAHRANVKKVLTGSIIKIGTRIRVTAQLLDARSGDIIGSDQADGNKVEDIFVMADELTQKIRENFHVSSVGAGGQPLKITDVTTSSFEAYKHYQKGLEHLWRWQTDEAAKDFERAVAIDSTFAMAYVRLAISKATNYARIRDFSFDLTPSRESLKRAKTFSAKATDKERSYIDIYKALADRHLDEADSLAVSLVKNYPDDREASFLLARVGWFLDNYDQQIQAGERMLEIDPTYAPAYGMLGYTYSIHGDHEKAISSIKKLLALQADAGSDYDSALEIYLQAGQLEEAWRLCEAWEKLDSRGHGPHLYRGLIHVLRGDGEKAREEYRTILTAHPEFESSVKLDIGCSFVSEGRYKEAVSEFKNRVELAGRAKNARLEILSRFDLGKTFLARGNYTEALEQFSEAEKTSTKIYNESFNPMLVLSGYLTGIAFVKRGDYQQALHSAERIKQLIEKNHYDSAFMDFYQMLYGELSVAQGDAQAAATAAAKLSTLTSRYPRRQSLVAAVHELRGDDEKAVMAYNKFLSAVTSRSNYSGGDRFDYFLERSRVKYNLAKIYDRKGDKSKAIEYYSKALEQWKHADKDLRELIETKARLAKLK